MLSVSTAVGRSGSRIHESLVPRGTRAGAAAFSSGSSRSRPAVDIRRNSASRGRQRRPPSLSELLNIVQTPASRQKIVRRTSPPRPSSGSGITDQILAWTTRGDLRRATDLLLSTAREPRRQSRQQRLPAEVWAKSVRPTPRDAAPELFRVPSLILPNHGCFCRVISDWCRASHPEAAWDTLRGMLAAQHAPSAHLCLQLMTCFLQGR